jgi:SAM-dependent methyltransferase
MRCCLLCGECFSHQEWRCPHCDFKPPEYDGIVRFVEDPVGESVGFKPEYFAKLAQVEEKYFWFRARNRLIQWALRTYFPAMRSLLEIGCGTGFVLAGLREVGEQFRLTGSEIFSSGLLFARARLPDVDLYQMDARQIPFRDEFDVVGAFDVLEHIAEDETVLRQMFKAIRPGGGLLLTVPQHPFLWSQSDEHAMHERRYLRKELSGKITRAGFHIERITSFITLLLPLMIVGRRRSRNARGFDFWREFEINQPLNKAFEFILSLERVMIKAGISLPVGGSLLLIGRKPAP